MSPIPRPVVYRERTESADSSVDYDRAMMTFRESIREQAIQELEANPEYAEIGKYIDALEGRHWRRDRPRYLADFVDNLVADTRENTITELTDIRSIIDVRNEFGGQWERQANICSNVIQDQWIRHGMDLDLADVIDHGLFGAGYWKIDSKPPGVLMVTPAGMDSVLKVNGARDIQKASAVLYRTLSPIQEIRLRFPAKSDGIEREAWAGPEHTVGSRYIRPGSISEYSWRQFSPMMRRFVGHTVAPGTTASLGTNKVFPSIPLEEYWVEDHSVNESSSTVIVKHPDLQTWQHNYHYEVKPGERLFPRKRLFIYAGNRLVYDGPSPYWHPWYPFAQLILNPMVWAPGGKSKYRSVMPFNRVINEVGAGVQDMIRKALKPQLITRKGTVDPTAWDRFNADEPGGRMLMNPGAGPQDFRYDGVPQIPGWVIDMLLRYYMPRAERHGGWLDPTRLASKGQVPGGDTIEQMRDLMPGHARMEMRYIDAFLRDSGVQAIPHIFQNFTVERRMQIMGKDGATLEDFDFNPKVMVPAGYQPETFWKNFGIKASSGSRHGGATDRKRTEAISLARMGLISRRELLRTLDWGNEDRIMEELEQEAQSMPDMAGRTPRANREQRNGSPV